MVQRTYKNIWYKTRWEFVNSSEIKLLMEDALKGSDIAIREVVTRARAEFSYSPNTGDRRVFDSMVIAFKSKSRNRLIS
jgi:hypothetical protein